MNRTIVIGIVGIVVVLIALGLNYWPSTEDELAPPAPTIATAPEPASEPAPRLQPAPTPAPAPAKAPEPAPVKTTAPTPANAPEPAPEPEPESARAPEPGPESGPELQPAPAPAPQLAPPLESAPAAVEPPPPRPAETQTAESAPQPPRPAETQTTEPVPEPAPLPVEAEAKAVILPEFDVVRIAPQGDVVVAGRAAPGSVVTVYDDGRPIGQIQADGRGEWVLLPDEPLAPGSRELSLSSRLGDADQVWSKRVVVVVVPEAGLDVAGQPSGESAGALVVEVPRTGFGASEVLQQPPAGGTRLAPAGGDVALTVDVLDYDEQGNLSLSGRANANSTVMVYLDNGLVAAAPAGSDGTWRMIIKRPVAPGLYTLRVDEMAGDKVVARLEFPFQRADPEEIESGTLLVVVQPGNSLWRLARRTLGEGTRYTVIYQANKDRIRDPDLIYPGQVFEVPRTN